MGGYEYTQFKNDHSNPVGTPATKPLSPPPKTVPVCSKCLSVVGPGKKHICSKVTFQSKVADMVKGRSMKSRSRVACSILKSVAADQGISSRGGKVELQSGSKTLPVSLGTPQVVPKQPRFTHEDLKRVQAAHNLSDRAIK